MAGLKEIKRRLRSVKNTQKITYAMKLVSAAKLRKAQDAVSNSRAYTLELNRLLAQLSAACAGGEISHPLLETRSSVKNIGLLVIGGQRGLCGGYNSNVNKKCDAVTKQFEQQGVGVSTVILGRKPAEYYRRRARSYQQSYEELPESALAWPIDEVVTELSAGFKNGTYDEVWVIYTRFRSAISQQIMFEKLLPLDPGTATADSTTTQSADASSVTLFEPSVDKLFAALMPRILATKVRQFALDAKASETAARMTAMDSATKNAKQLSRKLELQHNKIRQARITSELLDIIGGAEAVK